jgi:Zn-dependent protease/CBS domain-containing protein
MSRPPPPRPSPGGSRLLPVGRFFGVPLYFAPSWVLIAALITISYGGVVYDAVDGMSRSVSYLVALAFAVALALCILLHELGHVGVSLALGRPVRRVVIFLLGGISEIDGDLERPRDELLVAVAGPLVSLGIAGGAWLGYQATSAGSVAEVFWFLLFWSNLAVSVFNLLPGLPLDGGRVLRALIWGVTRSRLGGTKVAAWSGRVIAVVVVLPGLFIRGENWSVGTALFGLALGAFIWFGATQSLRAAEVMDRVPDLDLQRLMRPALAVPVDVSVAEAIRRTWAHNARGLFVVDAADHPQAIVDEQRLAAVPVDQQAWVHVVDVSRPLQPGLVLAANLRGSQLLAAVRATPATEYLVVRPDGSPAGILSAADLAAVLSRPPA